MEEMYQNYPNGPQKNKKEKAEISLDHVSVSSAWISLHLTISESLRRGASDTYSLLLGSTRAVILTRCAGKWDVKIMEAMTIKGKTKLSS